MGNRTPSFHLRTLLQLPFLLLMATVLGSFLLAACNGEDIESIPESTQGYFFSGVHTNVSVSEIQGSGWAQCHSETYATTTTSLSSIVGKCGGQQVMLSCSDSATNPNNLVVAAYANRSEVFAVTAPDTTDSHVANGVSWYYNPDAGGTVQSWGFFVPGDAFAHNDCDNAPGASNDNKKLCWHTSNGNLADGWRCGATQGLNGSTNFIKRIFTR